MAGAMGHVFARTASDLRTSRKSFRYRDGRRLTRHDISVARTPLTEPMVRLAFARRREAGSAVLGEPAPTRVCVAEADRGWPALTGGCGGPAGARVPMKRMAVPTRASSCWSPPRCLLRRRPACRVMCSSAPGSVAAYRVHVGAGRDKHQATADGEQGLVGGPGRSAASTGLDPTDGHGTERTSQGWVGSLGAQGRGEVALGGAVIRAVVVVRRWRDPLGARLHGPRLRRSQALLLTRPSVLPQVQPEASVV